MPAVCAADSGAFAQLWRAGLDSEIVFSLMKSSLSLSAATAGRARARGRAYELTVARQGTSIG